MMKLQLLTVVGAAALLCTVHASARAADVSVKAGAADDGARALDVSEHASSDFVPDRRRFYFLKTMFQGPSKCLEGNKLAKMSTLGGAAFMDDCGQFTGQMWQFVPAGRGYYRMKTKFQGWRKCFEGNRFDPSSTLKGAAFMDNCKRVSGQLWKIQQHGGGYFTLTTKFREPHGECLEGNKFAPDSTLKGAAFMAGCRPFSGQLFKAYAV